MFDKLEEFIKRFDEYVNKADYIKFILNIH